MEVSADQLKQAVEGQHGGKAVLVGAEPVKETFNGKTVWGEGAVHVFDLEGHPKATQSLCVVEPDRGGRQTPYAILHLGGIRSPLDAVRAAIVAERRNG
jgi:hypothetical protein